MAGISFVKVIDAGPRYTKVLADDGKTYTLKGDRNWRNNNPGNIEYGDFAKSMGAIGSDGRFAVFPSVDTGMAAQETLQFEGKNYRDKSVSEAISRYAPEFENNSAAYAAEVAAAAGVPLTTKMSDLTPEQRAAFIAAQHRVEGMKPGTIMGAEGEPVSPEVAEQFAAVRLPPGNVGGGRSTVSSYQQQLADRGFDPGPVDGISGPRTKAAVKAFQEANGLVVDGIVGPKTRAALEQAGGSVTLAPPPIPSNEDMPPRASFWQEAGRPPSTTTQYTEADTRAEQRTLGNGFKPLPAPAPLVAPPPIPQAGGSGLQETRFGPRPTPQAPMPMPGRPGSLNAQVPGVPTPGRPAGLNAAPPPSVPSVAAPKLLRLPSGAMIAPGVYDNAKSGIPYTVTEGPNGTAVINSQRSGFVDLGREINAPTILGGIIRSKIPEVAQDAMNNFAPAMDNVKSTAANAINSAVPMVQGFGNTIGGMFGGLFGGQPSGPQYQPGMMGRGLPTPQAPSPLMPSPMLRAVPQVPARRQQTRAERFTNLDEWGNIR